MKRNESQPHPSPEERETDVLRRMLSTPPEPHKPKKAKRKPKPKAPKKKPA